MATTSCSQVQPVKFLQYAATLRRYRAHCLPLPELPMVHELYAYLRVDDSARAIDFYRQAFGATEIFRLTEPSGRIGHAELDFNGTTLMISDAFPEFGMTGPQPGNGSPVSLHLHVDDADRLVQQALDAGAMLEMAPQDQFYGERTGVVIDPFGHRWMIGHEIEKLTPQEMQRRYTDMMQSS
jgi:uncharacterized glyoxalase superfamily protein PhnB